DLVLGSIGQNQGVVGFEFFAERQVLGNVVAGVLQGGDLVTARFPPREKPGCRLVAPRRCGRYRVGPGSRGSPGPSTACWRRSLRWPIRLHVRFFGSVSPNRPCREAHGRWP